MRSLFQSLRSFLLINPVKKRRNSIKSIWILMILMREENIGWKEIRTKTRKKKKKKRRRKKNKRRKKRRRKKTKRNGRHQIRLSLNSIWQQPRRKKRLLLPVLNKLKLKSGKFWNNTQNCPQLKKGKNTWEHWTAFWSKVRTIKISRSYPYFWLIFLSDWKWPGN